MKNNKTMFITEYITMLMVAITLVIMGSFLDYTGDDPFFRKIIMLSIGILFIFTILKKMNKWFDYKKGVPTKISIIQVIFLFILLFFSQENLFYSISFLIYTIFFILYQGIKGYNINFK